MTRRELSPALVGSVLLHTTVAVLLLVSWNFSHNLKEGSVVPVTIVSRAPDADLRPAEEAPVEQTAQTEEPTPQAPLQSTPPAPEPKPAPPPKPEPVPKVVKPIPAPTPVKPAPPAKPEKSLDLDALSASVSKMAKAAPPKPSSAAKGPARPETAPVARQTVGTGVSALAMSGLVAELRRHWHPNCEVEGARNVNVRVTFTVGAAGQVYPGSANANGSENSANPVVKAAAERAIRSVYEVAALKLITPDFYGQRVTATYPGNEACS